MKFLTTPLAVAATVATLGLTACGSSTTTTSTTGAAASTNAAAAARPSGAPAGMPQMQVVTGTAASKAKAAALAKYSGTVEKVTAMGTGYVVHVVTGAGEKHVAVSKDFVVTGLASMGGPGGAPPACR